MKNLIVISFLLLGVASNVLIAHGDEKHKEKVEKVSTAVQEEKDHANSDSLAQTKENETQAKDFAQIHEYVEKSTVPTVIKAISLAAFIAGFALLYLPRKKKENSND